MGRLPFDPDLQSLPAEIPIFPLPGVLLLPGGRLPLNIFEPRYLAMTQAALQGPRLIGMIQPHPEGLARVEAGAAGVYPIGCVGRMIAFSETEDGRYLITLAGLIRFRVAEELARAPGGYRRVRPDYSAYHGDLEEDPGPIERPTLLAALRAYFERHGLKADWDTIERATDERLVTSLAMLCPFEPGEKQVLLEAPTLAERAAAMTTILELAAHDPEDEGVGRPN